MTHDEKQYSLFLETLHRCEGTLVKICCTFTDWETEHVADLYQDIVSVLWRHWSSFRGESSVNTWITRVALNIACQHRRDRRRHPRLVSLDEDLYSLLAAEANDDVYSQLYHLIDLLSPDERRLIYLYLDQYPIGEIAAILRISDAAARKRLQRARERFGFLSNLLQRLMPLQPQSLSLDCPKREYGTTSIMDKIVVIFFIRQIYATCILGYADMPPISGCCYRSVVLKTINITTDFDENNLIQPRMYGGPMHGGANI